MYTSLRLILIVSLFAFVAACGGEGNLFNSFADDSSGEADAYQAQMDLDDGDYQAVIDYLGGKNPSDLSKDEAIILASAHLGNAGMDLLNLLDITDGGDTGDGNSFNTISALLGSSTLTADDFTNKSAAIQESLAVLALQSDNDSKTLAGVGAALDTVLIISEIYGYATGDLPGGTVDLNTMDGANVDNASLDTGLAAVPTAGIDIADNLVTLTGTIDSLTGNDNFQDLNQDLTDFKGEIDNDTDGSVTNDELKAYLIGI